MYGALAVLMFPGILTDPVVYDLGASCLILSFHAMGVLGGGLATALKKGMGVDVRGRTLELVVVGMTLWLTAASWGCVWGYFGQPARCGWGTLGMAGGDGGFLKDSWTSIVGNSGAGEPPAVADGDATVTPLSTSDLGAILRLWRAFFSVAKSGLAAYDGLWSNYAPAKVASWFCMEGSALGSDISADGTLDVSNSDFCLRMVHDADPDFLVAGRGADHARCAADLSVVTGVWAAAALAALGGAALRRGAERAQRRAAQAAGAARGADRAARAADRAARVAAAAALAVRRGVEPRPHQD